MWGSNNSISWGWIPDRQSRNSKWSRSSSRWRLGKVNRQNNDLQRYFVYRKRSRNSRKTNPPALAAKLGKSVCTCVYLYAESHSLGKKSKRTLEIELWLVIGQSYNQCYASQHCMGKLCLCGVGLLIATVPNTKKLLFYDSLLFWRK